MSERPAYPAPTRLLPQHPSLEQLRKQAKDLLEQYRSGDSAASSFARTPRHATWAWTLLATR